MTLREIILAKADENIKDLMTQAHSLLRLLAINDNTLEDNNSVIIADSSQEIIYQYSKATSSSLKQREINSINNEINVIDYGNCFNNIKDSQPSDYFVITTDFSDSIQTLTNNAIPNTQISVVNKNDPDNDVILDQCKVLCKIALLNDMDPELYNKYLSMGINIYNSEDPAFTSKCYYNNDMKFDTTYHYRRNKIYQGKQFSINSKCNLINDAQALNYTLIECPMGENLDYELIDKALTDLDKKPTDVPIRCAKDIDNIVSNIGFWIFIVMFVVIITYSIIYLTLGFKINTNLLPMLKNDKIIRNDFEFTKVANTENVATESNKDNQIKPDDVKISIKKKDDNETFGHILLNNFLELHPITSFIRQSVISPQFFTTWIFVFNTLNLFGFNALYFTNGKIEKRIYDNDRDNFGYPVKSEFEKIMSAIASTIVLTLIVKGISLVTYSQKKDLETKIDNGKNSDNTEKEIKIFNQSMLPRRIISWIFMLFVSVFFFYYSIVFCGIYINTQYGWFYSGIWSLFFNWVIFSNVFIFIVSLIEKCNGNEAMVYYMKKLFIF